MPVRQCNLGDTINTFHLSNIEYKRGIIGRDSVIDSSSVDAVSALLINMKDGIYSQCVKKPSKELLGQTRTNAYRITV